MKDDIIQNFHRQGQNCINLKRHTQPTYQYIHTSYLGEIGERRCAVRCCFICFFQPGLLLRWEFRAVMAEHLLNTDRPIPIFTISEYICFVHDSLQSKVTPSNLVSSTCSKATPFITRFSWGLERRKWFVPNTMLFVLEMFRTSLLLATHSKTDCNSF